MGREIFPPRSPRIYAYHGTCTCTHRPGTEAIHIAFEILAVSPPLMDIHIDSSV